MIVPSMTTEEIYKEIMRDFEIIKRRSPLEGKILHKEMWRKGLQHETRSLCYKTPYRNEWTIIFQMDTRGIKTGYYIKSHDKKGMVAYMIQFLDTGTPEEDKFVLKYAGHFFQRYNERMHLGLTDTSRILKHFFKNNLDHDLGSFEMLDCGVRCMHFIFKEGIGAAWQNDAKKTVHIKTFISNEMLTNSQRSLAEHIKYGGDDDEFYHTIKLKNLDTAF